MATEPEHPFGGIGYPSAPVDYPAFYPSPPWPGYHIEPYDIEPYDPYRIAQPAGTNGKAIGSLVASLVGLLCCGLPSVAGIVLGVLAMRETSRTGQDGYGMALAGTIVGGVVAALWLVFILTWLLGMILALHASAW
ncbi:MAG: DUF4190 domain-containing protein [Mycobacteriaceae bacterium]|nr:DUF4190 domain-containing protein [Mycobacteriaceae bacterium]MBV9639326.1 DUF4190 domain-containing protein [Mycobacteriaceae bacterium]